MRYVRLGSSGMQVSRICMGMMSIGNDSDKPWVIDEVAAQPIVRTTVEGGINYFDTSNSYSAGASEVATGRLLSAMLTRDEMVIATKVYGKVAPGANGGGLSRKHILSSIDASLSRLKMDYVDLYQVHHYDGNVPLEETMDALNDVVRAGKTRYLGASNMTAWQFAKAQSVADRHGLTRFVSLQNHYNLLRREEEREAIPQCIDQGVAVIPWSPLARGVLAGNRTRRQKHTIRAETDDSSSKYYHRPSDFDVVDRVEKIAAEKGTSMATVALAWMLHKPGLTAPIVGSTKVAHLADAIAAEQLELSTEDMVRLEECYVPHPIGV